MQNKPNLGNDEMNINSFATNIYEILPADSGKKTNPIQTQFKPIKANFNAKQSQFKPNCKKGFRYIQKARQTTVRPWQLLLSTRFGILV